MGLNSPPPLPPPESQKKLINFKLRGTIIIEKLEVLTMNAIKGIYHDGVIELIEKPETQETSEVLVIFPEKKRNIKNWRAL